MVDANVQTMLGYIRQRPIQTSFLLDMFVKEHRVHNTKTLVLDQIFGNREISPYVGRKSAGHVVGHNGYNSLTHIAPYVKEKCIYTADDADVREPGTTGFEAVNPIDAMIARDLDELDMRMVGREEKQIAEAIQTGKITVSGYGEDSYEVDFQQHADHLIELAGNDRWTVAAASSDAALYTMISDDLREWCQLPRVWGSQTPNVILADTLASALIKTAFTTQLDNRRVDYGFIRPEQLNEYNATYEGKIWGTGFDLQLYTYQGTYTINGSAGAYMNASTVVLGNRQAPVTMEYGKITNLKAKGQDFRARRFPNRWEEPDGSAEYITLETSPMVNLQAPRGFVSAHITNAA